MQVRTERALATVYARSSSSAWALLERSDERWKACEEDLTAAEGDADRLRQDLQREARWSAVFDALKVGGSVAATLLLVHVARNTP